jgi:shikimate kinase
MKDLRAIFLVGFSGSGKSTVGPLLARSLGMRFFDSDSRIEETEGRSVPEVLDADGERYFRTVESDAIRELVEGNFGPKVIALGGGALNLKENRDLLFSSGLVVYLSCSVLDIYRRLSGSRSETDRPLLRVKPQADETLRTARLGRIRSLLDKRKPRYRDADISVSTTSKTPRVVVAEVKRKLERYRD